jgi:o-succinylbenzoate---CoA ligase
MSAFYLHTPVASYSLKTLLEWDDHSSPADILAAEVAALVKNWHNGNEWFDFKTSGSTGQPKIIAIHRSQIEASATATLQFFQLHTGNAALCPLSLSVVGGQMMVYRSLIRGLELYVIPADKTLSQMNTHKSYAFMPISALQLFEVLKHDPEKTAFLNHIKNILIGGSSITAELQQEIHTKLTCAVWHSYGMTETVSHIAMKQIHPALEQAYTVLDSIEIRVNEQQCLSIKGGVTGNSWLQTNDIVELINNRQFNFIGRADFSINSGGVKVQVEPVEKIIETFLQQMQLSVPCFIAGIADESLGEKIVLFIESNMLTDDTKMQLLHALKELLPKYHAPKEIRTAVFAYTSSGKINRKETIKKAGL